MRKLILLVFLFASSCAHTESDVWDTCPSTQGMSCPEDGSPCPFCGEIKN